MNIIVTTGKSAPHRDDMPENSLFIAKPYRNAEVLEAVRSFDNANEMSAKNALVDISPCPQDVCFTPRKRTCAVQLDYVR